VDRAPGVGTALPLDCAWHAGLTERDEENCRQQVALEPQIGWLLGLRSRGALSVSVTVFSKRARWAALALWGRGGGGGDLTGCGVVLYTRITHCDYAFILAPIPAKNTQIH
jgi:hypothetical protein